MSLTRIHDRSVSRNDQFSVVKEHNPYFARESHETPKHLLWDRWEVFNCKGSRRAACVYRNAL